MKQFFSVLVVVAFSIFCLPSQAQWIEDFSDGDFTNNPTWIGVTDSFTVSSGQLRTTPGNASSVTLYLSSANTSSFTSWEFFFRLNFNPSSQNYAEFWLTTDNLDLDQAQNGYFIRLGGGNDGIGLFKKQSGTTTEIVAQSNTLLSGTSNNQGYIRVTRNNGTWELFEKITTSDFVSFGTGSDNALTSSVGLGVWIRSTRTNRGRHYFDDIRAEDNSSPDLTPPNLLSAAAGSSNTVELQFSETLDPVFSAQTSLYALTPTQTIISAEVLPASPSKVRLTLANPVSFGTNLVTVTQSRDAAGNTQTNSQQVQFFNEPVFEASPRDVVINEIFADESPSVGLPGAEFVELVNTTTQSIPLKEWTFSDASASVLLPDFVLQPGGHLILCKSADTTAYRVFGKTLAVNLPSLNNSGDLLTLKDPSGQIIDQVNYTLSWYRDGSKDDGGYSLEQINPKLKCSGSLNWRASDAIPGGTPGSQNSVFSNQADTTPPVLDSLVVVNSTTIRLVFEEALGSSALSVDSFSISNGLDVSGLQRPETNVVILILSGAIQNGVSYTLTYRGVKDCEGNASAQPVSVPFLFLPPSPLESRSLVINEIYADETPSLGLPKTEYLEILNTTALPVQLLGSRLVVGSTMRPFPDFVLPPGGYLILCDPDSVPSFQNLGPTLGFDLPLLTNSGVEIRIEDKDNTLVDKVSYDLSWYRNTAKQNGGFSLEQINPALACSGKDNWMASAAGIGGTPGTQNSVFSNAPDVRPPSLLSFEIVDSNSIQLNFSEPLTSFVPPVEFFELPGLGPPVVLNLFPFPESITLRFPTRFVPGVRYSLTLKEMRDCGFNTMPDSTFSIGVGKIPGRFDLLITEVQADDTPENTLPASEYIEIFNPGNQLLDLTDVQITDGGTPARLPFILLGAGEYLVLVGTGDAVRFSGINGIRVLEVPSLPTLNSEGDRLTLLSPNGSWIHRFFFESNRYTPYSLWTRGWSLEMIDTWNPCDEANNWAISTASAGGTPGKENSVRAVRPDTRAPRLSRVSIPDSVTIRLFWDELVDSTTLANASVSVSGGYEVNRRLIANTDLSSMFLTLNREIRRNEILTLMVGLVRDCAGNITEQDSLLTARPMPADSARWILNEILFDPRTGGSDYVEIRNDSPYYQDLKDVWIANDEDALPVSSLSQPVPSGAYVLLTESKALTLRDYPRGKEENIIEMGLPSFNSDSGTVRLLGPGGKEWQKFFYSDKFHVQILDETKGVSLERISPDLPVNEADSWHSASSDAGYGTPGYENSQDRNFDPEESFSVDPKAFSPNGDGNKDLALFSFESPRTGLIGNLRIYSTEGQLVKNLAESANLGSRGFWKWDGTTKEGRKARVGLYLAVLEMIELGGDTRYVKIPVAIAADR